MRKNIFIIFLIIVALFSIAYGIYQKKRADIIQAQLDKVVRMDEDRVKSSEQIKNELIKKHEEEKKMKGE